MKKLFLSAAVLLNTLVCINHVQAQWTTVGNVISQTDTTKKVSIGTKSNTSDLYVARNNAAAAIGVRSGTSNAILNMDKGTTGSNSAVAYKSQGVTSWNTGMLGNNNYSIKNVVSGTFPLVINTADNVGIGTATPNSKLDVEGNATGGEVFRFSNDKNGTKDSTMVMTGNGRVGIGTTSPTSKFNVNGQVTIDQKNFGGYGGLLIKGNAPGSNHPNIGFSLYNDVDVDVIAGFIQGNPTNTSPGNESMDLAFYTSTTGTGGLAARVYVKDDGKVGIGNSTPSEALDVTGNAQASGSIYVDAAQTNNGSVSDNNLRFGGSVSGELISSKRTIGGNRFGLDFFTGSTKRLAITLDGRVGIGTDAPGAQLDVQGDAVTYNGPNIFSKVNYTGNIDVRAVHGYSHPNDGWGYGVEGFGGLYGGNFNCNSGGYGAGWGVNGSATGTTGTQYGVYGFASGGTTNWAVYAAGATYSSGGYTSSDVKLKKDIKPITNAMDVISRLQPRSYNFRTDEYKYMGLPLETQYGFIAQELETVLPELIKNVQQPIDNDYKKNGMLDFKAINYTELIPLLTQAVQEQQKQIEGKDIKIDDLQNQLNDMQQCVQSLCESSASKIISSSVATESTMLFQNQPNPFSETTIIGYQLTGSFNSAKIIIRNLNGEIMRTIAINQTGKGEVALHANELKQGTYTYSLMLNDKCADTKLMVITK